MELSWLDDFLAVAKLRNFSRAATTRHTTQSALSKRIKALEAWYGVPLIDRSTYPVGLTDAGLRFVPLSEVLVAELYRSRREARAAFGAAGRITRFAMPHSLAVNFFPGWWRKERGSTELGAKVVTADLAECVERLLAGECQFLLHYSNAEVAHGLEAVKLRRRLIGQDRLVPVSKVAADGAPLFDLDAIANDAPLPLLAYGNDSYLGQVSARPHARLEAQRPLYLRYESSLVDALKAEVLLGEGIAWLPETSIGSEVAAGTLQIVGDDTLAVPLDVCLCYPETTLLPSVAQGLLDGRVMPQVGAHSN